MGMGGNRKKIEKLFSKSPITFCYCISEYPAPLRKINWKNATKYDGFSDHTLGIIAPLIFTILKKQQNAKNILIDIVNKKNKFYSPLSLFLIAVTRSSVSCFFNILREKFIKNFFLPYINLIYKYNLLKTLILFFLNS